jgi:protein-tyrosine phosphatase
MIDIHAHILPGVDDGAKTMNESLLMIQQAMDVGINIVCATPHILDGVSPILVEQINRSFQLLRFQLIKRKMVFKLLLGSEIYVRYDIASLRSLSFFSMNQTGKYILMEFPLGGMVSGAVQLIRRLKLEGITTIIAHPERCFLRKDELSAIENLVQGGALIQINAGSILGHFGKEAQKMAESLLEYNLVYFMASDAHSSSSASITMLSQASEKLCQLVGKIKTEELTIHNPTKMLEGKSLWSSKKVIDLGEQRSLEGIGLTEF